MGALVDAVGNAQLQSSAVDQIHSENGTPSIAGANKAAAVAGNSHAKPGDREFVGPLSQNGAPAENAGAVASSSVTVKKGESLSEAVFRFAHENGITYKQATAIVKASNPQFDWTKVDGNLHSVGLKGRDADLVHAGEVINFDPSAVAAARGPTVQAPAANNAPAVEKSATMARSEPAASKTLGQTADPLGEKAASKREDTLSKIRNHEVVSVADFEQLVLYNKQAELELRGTPVTLKGEVAANQNGLALKDSNGKPTIRCNDYHGALPNIGQSVIVQGEYDGSKIIGNHASGAYKIVRVSIENTQLAQSGSSKL